MNKTIYYIILLAGVISLAIGIVAEIFLREVYKVSNNRI